MAHQNPLSKKTRQNYMPEDVVEKIFSFLPFKKLCSLSILSKRFRNSWKFCRDLSFDADMARNLSSDEYIDIIENFFNNHQTTCAERFKLHLDASDDNNHISFWVGKAIRLGIKELELDLTQADDKITLNYDLINVESLKVLKLVNCELYLPLHSKGLRHLRELTLQNVMTPPIMTESIFCNCECLRALQLVRCSLVYVVKVFARRLECLVLKDCFDVHLIEVKSAPLLWKFHYHGKMMELRFCCDDVKRLSDVVLEIAHPRGFQRLSRRYEVVERLALVEVLTVTSVFLEGLCARFENNEYKKIEFTLGNLKEFHLLIAPESFLNPSDVALFIDKCPRIERLFIDLGKDSLGSSIYWDNYGKSYMNGREQATFPYLKHVKIKGFTMKEQPMCMARFFLKNATNLNRLILVKARTHHFSSNYNPENLRWGILSNARIEMYNYRADKNTIMPQHLRAI